jgi:hypothetical protein
MPTKKPRITITLSDHAYSVLTNLAQAQKVSMSSIVVDLVDTTLPVLEKLSDVLVNAALAPQSVLDDLRRSMSEAEDEMTHHGNSVVAQLDLLRDIAAGARVGDALAAPARVPAVPRPPTSNRGVRIPPPASKIEQISPMKRSEKHGRSQK